MRCWARRRRRRSRRSSRDAAGGGGRRPLPRRAWDRCSKVGARMEKRGRPPDPGAGRNARRGHPSHPLTRRPLPRVERASAGPPWAPAGAGRRRRPPAGWRNRRTSHGFGRRARAGRPRWLRVGGGGEVGFAGWGGARADAARLANGRPASAPAALDAARARIAAALEVSGWGGRLTCSQVGHPAEETFRRAHRVGPDQLRPAQADQHLRPVQEEADSEDGRPLQRAGGGRGGPKRGEARRDAHHVGHDDLDTLAHGAALGVARDERVGQAAGEERAEQPAELEPRHAHRGRPGVRHALGLDEVEDKPRGHALAREAG